MPELVSYPILIPEINLLSRFRTQLVIRAKRQLYIQLLCTIFLVLFGLSWLGLSAYNYYLHNQIKAIDSQVSTLTEQIKNLVEFESKYTLLKRKASALLGITQSARKHQDLVEDIFTLLPEGLLVNSFSIKENGEIIFDAKTGNPNQLHMFLNDLGSKKQLGSSPIRKITVSRITVNSEGQYTVGVIIQLT